MPVNMRTTPVIKGEDAKRFLQSEQAVNEKLGESGANCLKGIASYCLHLKRSDCTVKITNIEVKNRNLPVYENIEG